MNVLRAGAGECLFSDAPLLSPVDETQPGGRIADDDVVGDREMRDERQLLKDAGDTFPVGGGRGGEAHFPAFEVKLAFVGSHHSRHDLDERRFAGSVLSEDGVNTAGGNVQLGLLQRPHSAVALGNPCHAKQWRCGPAHTTSTKNAAGSLRRHRSPSKNRLLLVLFGLPHDLLGSEIDATGGKRVADEEVVRLVGIEVLVFLEIRIFHDRQRQLHRLGNRPDPPGRR